MRDVATLIWVVLIIVGVVSSIISSVRKQIRSAPAPQASRTLPRRPQFVQSAPPAAPTAPAPPPPSPRQAPVPPPHLVVEPQQRRRAFFGRKGDLVRAVIAAEVLGKPKALTDERFRY